MAKRLRIIALQAAMLVVALNIWTGSPLMALWIGSRLQGSGAPKMGPVFAVIVLLVLFSLLLAQLLARLSGAYERFTGHTASVHRHVAWLRSMRDERRQYPGQRAALTASERVLVLMVVVAIAAFEVWFFFFSASPIDQRSGRGQVAPPVIIRTTTPALPSGYAHSSGGSVSACCRRLPGGLRQTAFGRLR